MQELLLESPILLGLIGLVIVGSAVFIWTQTSEKVAIYVAAVSIVVTILLVLISTQIVTDRERIQTILDEVAGALPANDQETILGYIHPSATELLARVKTELPRYEFRRAKVTSIKSITVNTTTTPQTAIAEFNVVVQVGIGNESIRVPRFIKVYFMQRDGNWLVRDYEQFSFADGLRRTPSEPPGNY